MTKDTDEVKNEKKQKNTSISAQKVELSQKETKIESDTKKDKKDNKFHKMENKSVQNKVIENIKKFISKIIEMQEKVKNDEEEEKQLEKIEKDSQKEESKEIETKNQKYLLEYYDLPFRYNETVVKILAQTPKRLFVYWDVSDKDKKIYLNAFGETFFEDTYPVLLVHNTDKNYTQEVPINDFANSWYLDISNPRDHYIIQLGRKFKSHIKPKINPEIEEIKLVLNNDYLFIAMSNSLEVPNDHILFEEFTPHIKYRNVKTNKEEIRTIPTIIHKHELKTVYKKLYKDQSVLDEKFDMLNPSSSGINSSIMK